MNNNGVELSIPSFTDLAKLSESENNVDSTMKNFLSLLDKKEWSSSLCALTEFSCACTNFIDDFKTICEDRIITPNQFNNGIRLIKSVVGLIQRVISWIPRQSIVANIARKICEGCQWLLSVLYAVKPVFELYCKKFA